MLILDRESIGINNSISVIEKNINGFLIREVRNSEISWLIPPSEDSLLYSNWESVTTKGCLVVIKVPPKVWRAKVQNRYILPDYVNYIDKGVFVFQKYGKVVYIPKTAWEEGSCTNLTTFNDE